MANPEYAPLILQSLPELTLSARFPKIRACLFDMDGLLLDTEDIYTKCNNVILHEYGKPSLPWKIKAQLQGRPGPDVCLSPPEPFFPTPPRKLKTFIGCRNFPCLGPVARRPLHLHCQAGRTAGAILSHHAAAPRRSAPAENAQKLKHSTRARHFFPRCQLPLEVNALASPLQRVPPLAPHPWR